MMKLKVESKIVKNENITLLRIKEILFKNNYDVKNGIFKFSYSFFEKAFFLNKKSCMKLSQIY